MTTDVLTVSSRGQVVLPAPVRKTMSISTGDKLAVYATEDAILLKPIKMPTEDEFKEWLKEMTAWAAEVGYTEEDVPKIINEVRARKRS